MRIFPARYQNFVQTYLFSHRKQLIALGALLFLVTVLSVASPFLAGLFIDGVVEGKSRSVLIQLAAATIGLSLIMQVAGVLETWLAETVAWSATNDLREDLATHILHLDASWHAEHPLGELIERVDGDVALLANMFSRFVFEVIGSVLLLVSILGMLFWIDWRIGGLIAIWIAVFIGVTRYITRRAEPDMERSRAATGDFYGVLGEVLRGLEDIRSLRAGPWVMRVFTETTQNWFRTNRKAGMWGYAVFAAAETIPFLGGALAFGLAIWLFQQGAITLGAIYLVFRYTGVVYGPITRLRNQITDLQRADAGLSRILELQRTTSALTDSGATAVPRHELSLEFAQVSFAYHTDAPVLRNVDFRVEPGETLGVVGRTGSGKTTLTRLIPRLLDPSSGQVLLGSVALPDIPLGVVRERIGVVTQNVQIFHASVRDNLTLFDDSISDAELENALTSVGLTDWRQRFAQGLDTRIDGTSLSAGEMQLLTCARVLLRDPALVILDEASSRLDRASEARLHFAFRTLLQGRTGIVVAHRLSTLDLADSILVLENGEVVESGRRTELAARADSHYARLLRGAGEAAA